jgi:uncharacterized metal-binding protein
MRPSRWSIRVRDYPLHEHGISKRYHADFDPQQSKRVIQEIIMDVRPAEHG